MPLITTQIGSHPALDALPPNSKTSRDWLLTQLEYKHSQEVWKLLQPTNGLPSQRYVVQCLGMQEQTVEVFGIPTVFYIMHTLMAYLDEVDCLQGDIVAPEALGYSALEYNAQYIRVPIELGGTTPHEYKRRIYDYGAGIDHRQMVVWERIE